MRKSIWRCVTEWARMLPVALLCAPPVAAAMAAAPLPDAANYRLDESWPKLPIPNHWALHSIGGIFVDSRDHVWIHHVPTGLPSWVTGAAATPPAGVCCIPAPPVIEFDVQGNVVHAWGGPGQGYDWPADAHGIYVDYKGNVWLGGDSTRVNAAGAPPDGMVLKFSPEGKFLLQIGSAGPAKGNLDTTRLSGAANVAVDPKTNEVYIADGYGNHRVIVFDADTGAFKRMWGAYGKPPADDKIGPYDPAAPPAAQFRNVHCVQLANDGLVYVCDRQNDRIQVFKHDGTFVTEYFFNKETRGSGSVGSIAFWPDAQQSLMAINDPGNFAVHLVRRADGKVLSTFGHYGTYAGEFDRNHEAALDSHGNIYISEDSRVQKFTLSPK